MVVDVFFLELVAVCVVAALFVLLLFHLLPGRIATFRDILIAVGEGVYLAFLLQLTGMYGGWVLAAGLGLPLVGFVLYGVWRATEG